MTLHLWYRNRELVACSHAAWLAQQESNPGQPPRDADGSNLSEDPAEVTCLDCLRAGHYRTRADAAAVLALLRLGESIGLDDPRIVPVRSQLLQVGPPLDAFRLDLSSICQIPGCTRLRAEAVELAGAMVPAETIATLPAADAQRAALVNRRVELEREGLCYLCADQRARGGHSASAQAEIVRLARLAEQLAAARAAQVRPYRSCSLSHCAEPAQANGRCAEHQDVVAQARPGAAQVISLTVDVTDPAHPAHHGSFPLGLRPAQLAAGRAALRAAAQTLDHRLKEALHEPAAPTPRAAYSHSDSVGVLPYRSCSLSNCTGPAEANGRCAEHQNVVAMGIPDQAVQPVHAPGRLTRADVEQFAEQTVAEAMARAQQRHAPEAGAAHRAPDLHQRHQSLGREVAVEAWEVPPPSKAAGLAAWFVRHPAAHGFWCWWLVAVVHLRPGEGLPAAVLGREGQTHELVMIPLSPQSEISPDHPGRAAFMSADQVLRLCALTDAQAVRVCRAAVEAIVAGQSPDSDHRARWRAWAESACEKVRAPEGEVPRG